MPQNGIATTETPLRLTRQIPIQFSWIRLCALLYIIVPIVLFFGGWLKWYFALPGIALLLVGGYRLLKGDSAGASSNFHTEKSTFLQLTPATLILIAVIVLAWSFLAGQGGYFYQSTDHHVRNAIFRDLIIHPWPVKYPIFDSALVYYIAHWLVPAFIGKGFALFGGPQVGWLAGNAALYIWTSLGLFIVAILLIHTVGISNKLAIGIALLCLVFFSGMDIVGILPRTGSLANLPDHLEWWAGLYQFSSNTTLLFWVFNQTVLPWIVVLLILNEKGISNYAFLGLSVLPFAPLPFVGLAIILASLVGKKFIESHKEHAYRQFALELFSLQNILAIVTLLPIIGLYFAGNSASSKQGFRLDGALISGTPSIMFLLIFCLLEFGIYAIILFPTHKKDWIFLTSVISLIAIPVFKVGYDTDFAMRASIPALFILMVFIIRHLAQTIQFDGSRLSMPISTGVLVGALLLGSVTPLVEYQRAFRGVATAGKLNAVADNIISFDKIPADNYPNCLSGNLDSRPFFKYLAK